MNTLKDNRNAYPRLLQRGGERGKKKSIEFEEGMLKEIQALEALREDSLIYRNEFEGKENKAS